MRAKPATRSSESPITLRNAVTALEEHGRRRPRVPGAIDVPSARRDLSPPRARVQTLPWCSGESHFLPHPMTHDAHVVGELVVAVERDGRDQAIEPPERELPFELVSRREEAAVPSSSVQRRPPRPAVRAQVAQAFAARRLRGDDLIGALVFGADALRGQRSALATAAECLDLVAGAIPCRSAIIHFFDAERAEFVVAHATGDAADFVILQRHPAADALLQPAVARGKALSWNGELPIEQAAIARIGDLGMVRSVLVAPLTHKGACLGAIELVDPLDGASFDTDDEAAITYVALRCAILVAKHGVVVDVAAIRRRAFPSSTSEARG